MINGLEFLLSGGSLTKRPQTGMKPTSRWSYIQSSTHWWHLVFSVRDTVIVLAKEPSFIDLQL